MLPRSPAGLAVALLLLIGLSGASAQLPSTCVNCSFTVSVVDWNGTVGPGAVANGTLRIANTGQMEDSYDIAVTSDNDTWIADVDPKVAEDIGPGAGLLASDDNTFDFEVTVLVPDGASAESVATITVTVTSQNMADNAAGRVQTQTLTSTAAQVYAWALECTGQVTIRKTETGTIHLNATNQGNGADEATIRTNGQIEGLEILDPARANAGPGETASQTVTVGAGLRIKDGDYPIRFDLRRAGDAANTLASCDTKITVTGGTTSDGGGGGGGGGKDSPAPPPLAMLVAIGAALALLGRRVRP